MPHWPSLVRMHLAIAALMFSGWLIPTPSHAGEGAWKERTQVIWSKDTGTLIRKSFRVWDPHPELNLDFLWEPDPTTVAEKTSDDVVNGRGALTWHAKGAANYDRRFTYSVFKGVLKNGRPEGEGVLGVRNGLSYTGHWVNGEMHGHGVLRLPNGDKYEGDFVAGKMHGIGRHVAIEGTIFLGEFRNGLRHGIGKLTTAEGAYRTVWRDGREVARQRIPNSSPAQAISGLQPVAAASGVKLKLSLDQKAAREHESLNPDISNAGAKPAPTYDAEHKPGSIVIGLASKTRLAAWKSNAPIASGRAGPPYVKNSWSFPPVFLKAEIQNQGSKPTEVKGAYLEVAESTLDPTPYLELDGGDNGWCEGDGSYDGVLNFDNLGWGEVRDARVTYSLGSAKKRTQEVVVPLGTFERTKQISLEEHLQKLGVDVERLRKASTTFRRDSAEDAEDLNEHAFKCEYKYDGGGAAAEKARAACFEREKKSGLFGSLRDMVFRQKNDNVIYVGLNGRIEYQWSDRAGKSSARVSTFSLFFPLMRYDIEMGEMGCPDMRAHPTDSVELSVDRQHYRIPLSAEDWKGSIGRNAQKQFQFSVATKKSSRHVFQLVVELTDGELKSLPIDLLYFDPRPSQIQEQREKERQELEEKDRQEEEERMRKEQEQRR
jgi:hypothetical protein